MEEEEERERKEELVRILTKIQDTLNDRAFVKGLQRSLDRGGSGLFGGLRDAIFQAVINALVAQVLAGIGELVVQLDNRPGKVEIHIASQCVRSWKECSLTKGQTVTE